MTHRGTPLALSMLTVAAWAVSLAIFTGRPEPFVVALPLLVTLGALALRPVSPAYEVTHAISAERVFEGESLTVTVSVTARSPIALMELVAPLHPDWSLTPQRHRSVLSLRANQTSEWSYE